LFGDKQPWRIFLCREGVQLAVQILRGMLVTALWWGDRIYSRAWFRCSRHSVW